MVFSHFLMLPLPYLENACLQQLLLYLSPKQDGHFDDTSNDMHATKFVRIGIGTKIIFIILIGIEIGIVYSFLLAQ